MRNNITLIGMAGAGKSAVGKVLAEKVDFKFIDIDKIIAKEFNLKLQEIIDKHGEKKFLEEEEKAVLTLGDIENCIISPGGSIVYSDKAMKFLKDNSRIVFLDVPLDLIELRIGNHEPRGVIGLDKRSIEEIFKERKPLYEKGADIIIKVESDMSVGHIAETIISKI